MTNLTEAEVIKRERWYVLILAAIQVSHILDFVIMMPLGTIFMRVFDISPVEFSTLVSAYTFSAAICGFFGALYADHFDRKKFLLFNFSGFILGTFFCALAPNFATLLGARIIAGAFGGILNASVLSLVSDLIPFKRRGAAMGVVMSAFSVSSILGVPTGLYIANLFDWHAAFYFICGLGIIFWILSFIILPSVKGNTSSGSFSDKLKNFQSILSQKDYLLSFSLTSVLSFGVFMIVPFIAPYLVKNAGISEDQIPLIYFVGGICTIISARNIGRFCDKIGSFRVFKVVALLAIFPMLALTNLPAGIPLWTALIVTSLFTMSGSGRFIPAMTLISAVVDPKERGTFMGLENASRQLSAGIASQMAGLIIGSTASGGLTNYNYVGFLSITTSVIGIFIARKLTLKFH